MIIEEQQRDALRKTIDWARQLHENLEPLLQQRAGTVHFRPSAGGISMVGLHADKPQRGKSGLTDLNALVCGFEELFQKHCVEIEQGRPTPEKEVQSFLIGDAYRNGRKMKVINEASRRTAHPVELMFVTDEIALPLDGEKTVCDILALRVDEGRSTPVVMELKSQRELTRLQHQVEAYAGLVDAHAALFAELFGALLGRKNLKFDGRAEKWIVWPATKHDVDPREKELLDRGIRVVAYDQAPVFAVGRGPTRPAQVFP